MSIPRTFHDLQRQRCLGCHSRLRIRDPVRSAPPICQRRGSDSITALSMLSKATVELSLERSLLQVGLALPGPFPQEFRTLLSEQRTKSTNSSASSMIISQTTTLPREEEFRAGLSTCARRSMIYGGLPIPILVCHSRRSQP